jgi:hypothetical protein
MNNVYNQSHVFITRLQDFTFKNIAVNVFRTKCLIKFTELNYINVLFYILSLNAIRHARQYEYEC